MKNAWENVIGEVDAVIWNDVARQANGPGSFNMLDALVVGAPPNNDTGIAGPGLSVDEARSHMSLWVALASPLLLGFGVLHQASPPPTASAHGLTNVCCVHHRYSSADQA